MSTRSTLHRTAAIMGAVLSLSAAPLGGQQQPSAARQSATASLRIPYERYTLPNGLTVILAQDRSTPTVAVDIWYHVGSKNEVPGRTGFAHLFEHVMFTGSGNIDYGLHDRYTFGVGGINNGTTNTDRTNYFQVVPSNYLQTVLWLESDRMGFLLDALDSAKFIAQRDVVQNERRQGVDNVPYGRANEVIAEAMYPRDHPHSWPVIGHLRDLQMANLDDVKHFFRTWYGPNNASLAIAGDFDPDSARAWVRRYFGEIPSGPPLQRPPVPSPRLTAETRLVLEDRVQVPRLYLRWPTVGVRHDDEAALSLLGRILAGPRTARLTRALVFDRQVAATVSAGQFTSEAVGSFGVIITPRPGNSLEMLEAEADSIIARLAAEGPTTDELTRAKAGYEFALVSYLESPLGKAETLLQGQVFHGDPARYRADVAAQQRVTPADVQRVARTYLGAGRVVLSIVPMGALDQASKPGSSTRVPPITQSTSEAGQ